MAITKEEKSLRGKELRKKCSRSSHAEWKPLRTWEPIKLLEESNVDRIPGLIPIRYERMSESPFTFFRGSAIIQARDLANSPASGIKVQICGDCHLMNFGGFASPERSLVFDINDFDETFLGSWEWDVKRLAVSFVLAARDLGFPKNVADDAVRSVVSSYRERMLELTEMSLLERWYAQIKFENLLEFFAKDKDAVERLSEARQKAALRTSETLFPKLTDIAKGMPKIKDEPPLIYHLHMSQHELEKKVQKSLDHYKTSLQEDRRQLFERYALEDVAIKVVGIGSVGTRCYVALFLADGTEPLFLQAKEARRSVLEPPNGKSRFAHQGFRIVHGQRLMQAASDIFLGWHRSESGLDFYIRQLHDMKVSAKIETFKPRTLLNYGTMCGWALARAHAKAGDADMIAGYLGSKDIFDNALIQYASAYADQVSLDYRSFKAVIKSGRLRTKHDDVTIEFEI